MNYNVINAVDNTCYFDRSGLFFFWDNQTCAVFLFVCLFTALIAITTNVMRDIFFFFECVLVRSSVNVFVIFNVRVCL